MNYRELVEYNLETARQSEIKEFPKMVIFVLIVAVLLGLNGFGLLVKGRGIILFGTDYQFCGVLSFLFSAVAAALFIYLVFDNLRNRKPSITAKRMDAYLKSVRELGAEALVFEEIESLEPAEGVLEDLRFDSRLIAGTSNKSPEGSFIYPISAVCEAGMNTIGSEIYIYLHMLKGKKTYKHSMAVFSKEAGQKILDDLKAVRPDLRINVKKEN